MAAKKETKNNKNTLLQSGNGLDLLTYYTSRNLNLKTNTRQNLLQVHCISLLKHLQLLALLWGISTKCKTLY